MMFPSSNGEFIIRNNFDDGNYPYNNIVTQQVYYTNEQTKFGNSIIFPQTISSQAIQLGTHDAYSYIQIVGSPTSFYSSRHLDFWLYIDSTKMAARNNYYSDYILKTAEYGYTNSYEYYLFATIHTNTSFKQIPSLSLTWKTPRSSIYKVYYNNVTPFLDTWIHIYIGVATIFYSGSLYKTGMALGVNGNITDILTSTHEYSHNLQSNLYFYGIPGYANQIRIFNFDDYDDKIQSENFIPYTLPYPIYTSILSSLTSVSSLLSKQFENNYKNIVNVNSNLTYNATQYGIYGNIKEFINSQYTNYKDCKIFVYDVLSGNLLGDTIPNIDGNYEIALSSNNNVYVVCVNTNSNNLYSSLIKHNITPNILNNEV